MEERPIEDETTELAAADTPVEPAEALEPTEAAPESNALGAAPAEDQSEAPAEAAAVPAEAAPESAESAPQSAVAAPKEPAPEAAAAKKAKVKNAVMIGVIVALIVVLLPLLIINLTLIIKGSLNPDMPPDLFGTAPLAVTTDAMAGEEEGCFSDGALIFVKLLEEDENVLKIIYEAHDFIEPRYGHVNSPYSIEAINKGTIPWLRLRDWNSGKTIVSIYAGCTLKKFMQTIQKNGGKIYLQIENI